MKIIFPLVKDKMQIVYPDIQNLFSNVIIQGTNVIADYSGIKVFTEYLDDIKTQMFLDLKIFDDAFLEAMENKYSRRQIATFEDKRKESLAYRADINAPTPYIDAVVLNSTFSKAELMASILVNVDAFAAHDANVSRIKALITNATTNAELEAITF